MPIHTFRTIRPPRPRPRFPIFRFSVLILICAAFLADVRAGSLGLLGRRPSPGTYTSSVRGGPERISFALQDRCVVTVKFPKLSGSLAYALRRDGTAAVLAQGTRKGASPAAVISRQLEAGSYELTLSSQPATRTVKYTLTVAAEFVADDVEFSGTIQVRDPEYDSTTRKATWRDGTTLWVADVDAETGFIELNGRVALDSGLTPASEIPNGPEWAVSASGSRILYSKNDGPAPAIHEAVLLEDDAAGGEWDLSQVPGLSPAHRPFGSMDPNAPLAFVKYDSGERQAWKQLDAPGTGGLLPDHALAGRFLPASHLLIYSKPVKGFQQLTLYHLFAKQNPETVVTTGSPDKVMPFALEAPEFGGEPVIVCAETSPNRQGINAVGVYRFTGRNWEQIKKIASPNPALPAVDSPEPFTFAGKTYVSFLALRDSHSPDRKQGAEVWVAGASPGNDFLRRVSGNQSITRSDPEWIRIAAGDIGPDVGERVYIYYTEVKQGGFRSQHRCLLGRLD